MWAAIIRFLAGGGISAIGSQIVEWQRVRENAKNDHERIEADKMIATLKASEAVILQAQRDPYERWIRIGLAVPIVIYNGKLFLWDKVLGLGATDPLSSSMIQVQAIVLAGYFIHAVARGR